MVIALLVLRLRVEESTFSIIDANFLLEHTEDTKLLPIVDADEPGKIAGLLDDETLRSQEGLLIGLTIMSGGATIP